MYAMNNVMTEFFKPELTSEVAELFKPVQTLVEVNTKTVEVLFAIQKASVEELANAGMDQFKALAECKDPKAALDLQVNYYKTVESKLTEAAEKSIAAMTAAKDAYVTTAEESGKKVTEMAEEAAKKVAELKVA